jgi:hypothetical protein
MKSFGQSKYGYIALSLSLAELIVIWGGQAVIYAIGLWGYAPHWLADVFVSMYLAGLIAVGVAVLGLAKDPSRLCAGLALLVGCINLVACAIPIAGLR